MARPTRRRSPPWRILLLVAAILGALYVNQFVVPNSTALFVPTPTPTRSPEAFINEAEALYRDGKLLQSIEAYKKAIQANPQNQSYYVALARVQVFAGQYEAALESAERALVGNEDYAMAHAVRGWALNFLEDYLQAEAAVKRALELDPNNALAHAYYTEILVNKNDFGDRERAIEESRIAYNLAPNLLEAIRARAYVMYVTGNYQESLDLYQAAANLNKNIPDLYLYMGYNYLALEDYDQAVQAFLQANALNPADAIPDLELSRTYFAVGDYGKSVQYAESAAKDEPANPYRYGNLGMMYYENGELEKAIDSLSLAIRGGTAPDGTIVEGVPLDYGWIARYYWYYGFALAKVIPNRCSEAIPIFQALLTGVTEDPIALENATVGLQICEDAVGTPSADETTTPAP